MHFQRTVPNNAIHLTEAMAGIDSRVLAQPTLTFVQGGTRVVGGDVGVPFIGAPLTGARDTVLNRSLRAPSSPAFMQPLALAEPALTSTYATEEAYKLVKEGVPFREAYRQVAKGKNHSRNNSSS